jgi:hypothetical protein
MTPSTPKQEPLATASIILACLGFMLGPFTAVPAIICGHMAKNKIQKNTELSGSGLATAGLIVGYVFLVISVFAIALFFINPVATK